MIEAPQLSLILFVSKSHHGITSSKNKGLEIESTESSCDPARASVLQAAAQEAPSIGAEKKHVSALYERTN